MKQDKPSPLILIVDYAFCLVSLALSTLLSALGDNTLYSAGLDNTRWSEGKRNHIPECVGLDMRRKLSMLDVAGYLLWHWHGAQLLVECATRLTTSDPAFASAFGTAGNVVSVEEVMATAFVAAVAAVVVHVGIVIAAAVVVVAAVAASALVQWKR
jgi:hypothetical protein